VGGGRTARRNHLKTLSKVSKKEFKKLKYILGGEDQKEITHLRRGTIGHGTALKRKMTGATIEGGKKKAREEKKEGARWSTLLNDGPEKAVKSPRIHTQGKGPLSD